MTNEDSEVISKYLADLERAFVSAPLSAEATKDVVAETRDHLEQMFADRKPSSSAEREELIREFGSASALARTLSAEYKGARSRRIYLWPAVFALACFISLHLGLAPWLGRILDTRSMILPLLAPCALILFLLGFFARRPLFGQFVSLGLLLVMGSALWNLRTSYAVAMYNSPVQFQSASKPSRYLPVSRDQASQWAQNWERGIATEQGIVDRLEQGKAFFVSSNDDRPVPANLRVGTRYILPFGVRSAAIGFDARESQNQGENGDTTNSWAIAVKAWNGKDEGWAPSEANQADRVKQMSLASIEEDRRVLQSLTHTESESLSEQLVLDLIMVLRLSLIFTVISFVFTNLGWLAWFTFRSARRLVRRTFARAV